MSGQPNDAMICNTCKQILDKYRARGGEVGYVHTRSWEDYDHEADPVPSDDLTHAICDFCYATPVIASWVGSSTTMVIAEAAGGQVKTSGDWAACITCDKLLKAKTYQALLTRTMRAQKAHLARAGSGADEIQMAEYIKSKQLQGWFGTIRARKNLAKAKMIQIKPSHLPRCRDQIAAWWANHGAKRIAAGLGSGDSMFFPGVDLGFPDRFGIKLPMIDQESAENFARRISSGLHVSDCYWISKEFTHRAVRGARTLTDLTVTREDLPCDHGFVVFDGPVFEMTTFEGDKMPLTAISWTLVPDGIWFTPYVRVEHAPGADAGLIERYVQQIGHYLPWASGGGARFTQIESDGSIAHENIAILLSVFMFINTARVTEVTETPLTKGQQRTYKHADGQTLRAPTVRVVDIRRKPRGKTLVAGELRGAIDYQMEISGYAKMQHYGPARGLRKRIWVDSYWKGPEDAPVRFKGEKVETVQVLR